MRGKDRMGKEKKPGFNPLIHLDRSVDALDKCPAGEETDGTGEDEDDESNHGRISHVEHRTGQATEAHAGRPKEERIDEEHISAGHTSTGKGPPVPPVVLRAEQEVHQQNGRGCRGDDHQSIAKEQEPKHVIDPVGPERGHDEVKFNEDGTEGENSGQEKGRDGAQTTGHRRHLARDLVGLGWALDRLESTD